MTPDWVDPEALLCALVLAPVTFSRNRFYELFKNPVMRRVRSRATQLRTIVRHLAGHGAVRADEIEHAAEADGRTVLRYRVASLGLARTAVLEPLEGSLVRFALARAGAVPSLAASDEDRSRVEHALVNLGRDLDLARPGSARADA